MAKTRTKKTPPPEMEKTKTQDQVAMENLINSIDKINHKENKIIFLAPDTQGNVKASVMTLYRYAHYLKEAGYDVIMLHEKEDFIKVGSWYGEKYDELNHISMESKKLRINPCDILIIPESFGSILPNIQDLSLKKIMLIQNYEQMLIPFAPGKTWMDFNVIDVITTSPEMENYIRNVTPHSRIKVIPQSVGDDFTPTDKPKEPTIAIFGRNPQKNSKLIKEFYLRFPQLKWISFKDLHGINYENFAKKLKNCFVAIWHDQISSFPLFAVEAAKCDVPLIGMMPDMMPEWLNDDTGMWTFTDEQILELLGTYITGWVEDSVPDEMKSGYEALKDKFIVENEKERVIEVFNEYININLKELQDIKIKIEKKEENGQ